MVFSDLFFLYAFLPAFILLYLLKGVHSLPEEKRDTAQPDSALCTLHSALPLAWQNSVLIVFSLIFYAWGEPLYVFLMLFSVWVNFFCGKLLDKTLTLRTESVKKWALALGVAVNLFFLIVFKYSGFLARTLTQCGYSVPVPDIDLPIGISFYTFQSISYLVDVYRGEAPVQKKFSGLLLYISMFPQLIAGPIVRYNTVAKEINNREITTEGLYEGLYRFFIGLGKKVIFANQFSEIADQFLAGDISHLTTSGAWVGILAFTLQIYFDFSGYSDMAIGLGRCLGFHFNENFNHPYCCTSITDFWRRWHMSLGSFFRDYVYIPLGGNRRHQFLNIFIVWALTGMWHGASWNFILWGLYFGVIVSVEKRFLNREKGNQNPLPPREEVGRGLLRHLYAMLLVIIGWGIFYFDSMTKMGHFFATSFGFRGEWHSFITESALTDNFWLWAAAIVACLPLRHRLPKPGGSTALSALYTASRLAFSLLMIIVCTALLVGATNNAFIYTRF